MAQQLIALKAVAEILDRATLRSGWEADANAKDAFGGHPLQLVHYSDRKG